LRIFENSVLRRIFGPKWEEVAGGRRRLHCEELHNFCFSPSIIREVKSRRMKWAGYSARIGYKKYTYLVGKLEGNRPLG
jgi:hypothetical protein